MKNYWKWLLMKNYKDDNQTIIYDSEKGQIYFYCISNNEKFKIDNHMLEEILERDLSSLLTIENVKLFFEILPKKYQKKFWDYFYISSNLKEVTVC